MKRLVLPVALGLIGPILTLGASPAYSQSTTAAIAQVQTTTFAIENMTCALCPVTVKTAMEQVAGVRSVEIDFDAKTALVVFDPARTSIEAIASASTNAGYPARVAS
jgi:periplasmic mercuric ion binding protein